MENGRKQNEIWSFPGLARFESCRKYGAWRGERRALRLCCWGLSHAGEHRHGVDGRTAPNAGVGAGASSPRRDPTLDLSPSIGSSCASATHVDGPSRRAPFVILPELPCCIQGVGAPGRPQCFHRV